MMKNPDEYNVLLVDAQFANITFDIGRPFITVEELGSYDYWKSQGLSLDEMKYLAWRLKAPMSKEAFVDLWYGYYEHDAMQKGLHGQANFRTKGSSGGGFVIPTKSIPQSGETTPPKGKTFFQKFFEDSQKMGIVSGGGSNWGNKKKSKTGETVSENGKVSDNETGSGSTTKPEKDSSKSENDNTGTAPSSKTSGSDTTKPSTNNKASKNKPDENETGSTTKPEKDSSKSKSDDTGTVPSSKTSGSDTTKPSTNSAASKNKPNENESESPLRPAKNASESESTNTSRTPSSKTSESDTTTAPKNSTKSKNKQNQDDPPNEVNSWKTTAPKNKDEGKPQADSKPSESSQSDKPKENSNANKQKEDSEGTEGTGKPTPTIKNKFPDEELPNDGKILSYTIVDGKIKGINGRGKVDFVIDKNGNLIIGDRHHTLGNRDEVLAAGQLDLNGKGQVRKITNDSGHYQPTPEEAMNYPQLLRNVGLDTKGALFELDKFTVDDRGIIIKIERVLSKRLTE